MKEYIAVFELLAFTSSLLSIDILLRKKHLRLFPVLLFFVVLTDASQILYPEFTKPYNVWIYNWFLPIHHVLYLLIIFLALDSKRYKKTLKVFTVLFSAIFIFSAIFYQDRPNFNVISYTIGSIFLIVGILLKFHEILKSPTEFNFLKEPFFYMLFAFFLFTLGTLPYFTTLNWLSYGEGVREFFNMISYMMSILNYILYGTYTICFLWMRLRKASY